MHRRSFLLASVASASSLALGPKAIYRDPPPDKEITCLDLDPGERVEFFVPGGPDIICFAPGERVEFI